MGYDSFDDELRQMYGEKSGKKKIIKAISLKDPIESIDVIKPLVVKDTSSLISVIKKMQKRHSGCVLVVSDKKLVGIFTERDVMTSVVGKGLDLDKEKISSYMTPDPEVLQMTDEIAFALNNMATGGFRHVPVIDREGLYSVIAMQDIINHIGEYYFNDIINLPPKPNKSTSREGA